MCESSLLGRVVRIAVGPAFDHTHIKFLDVLIRRAWLDAEHEVQPQLGEKHGKT